ncbi:MAG: hypothetical protein ACTSPY_15785 [Candidatus Helarchaeota archaeon]
MGKIYSILMMIIITPIIVYIVDFNNIINLYIMYYSESVWGILIAILREILFFNLNIVVYLIILLIIGFLGGVISKKCIDGIYSAMISGVMFSIIWIILSLRFTPNYWITYVSDYFFVVEIIFMGILIGLIYLLPSLLGSYLISYKKVEAPKESLEKIEVTCPYCKNTFKSNPVYCCYCNKKLRDEIY